MNKVTTGLDKLLRDKLLPQGTKVGLLAHAASVDSALTHAAQLLYEDTRIELVALFGPQHGFSTLQQDNMIETPHVLHALMKIPVHSLYSETRQPTPEMLDDIDVLVVDLQDVGTRVYTYIWTLLLCMRACRDANKPVVVLDRPNPIGGVMVEGNVLDMEYESFVGHGPIPMRHGMTIGELALLFNAEYVKSCELSIVEMDNYQRHMNFRDTGLPWVAPSPNLPSLEAALVYPGMVLIEGTNLSEGRGTTQPFEFMGAPFINSQELADDLNARSLPGVYFRPHDFEPTFHKFMEKQCGGIQVHVTDAGVFKPYCCGLEVLSAMLRLYPDGFAWRQPPYEYEEDLMPIDILIGESHIREELEKGTAVDVLENEWKPKLQAFNKLRESNLLY
jgi:uncharacterized protein YbbC (DUF1343 family)